MVCTSICIHVPVFSRMDEQHLTFRTINKRMTSIWNQITAINNWNCFRFFNTVNNHGTCNEPWSTCTCTEIAFVLRSLDQWDTIHTCTCTYSGGTSDKGPSEKGTTSLKRIYSKVYFSMELIHFELLYSLPARNKMVDPKQSFT